MPKDKFPDDLIVCLQQNGWIDEYLTKDWAKAVWQQGWPATEIGTSKCCLQMSEDRGHQVTATFMQDVTASSLEA